MPGGFGGWCEDWGMVVGEWGGSENFLYIPRFYLLSLNYVNVLPIQIINKSNLYSPVNPTEEYD